MTARSSHYGKRRFNSLFSIVNEIAIYLSKVIHRHFPALLPNGFSKRVKHTLSNIQNECFGSCCYLTALRRSRNRQNVYPSSNRQSLNLISKSGCSTNSGTFRVLLNIKIAA